MKTYSQILTTARRLLESAKIDLVEDRPSSLEEKLEVIKYLLWVLDN